MIIIKCIKKKILALLVEIASEGIKDVLKFLCLKYLNLAKVGFGFQ